MLHTLALFIQIQQLLTLSFSDGTDLYNVPPNRSRPLKIAIPEKEDFDDIYDTPSATPASAPTASFIPSSVPTPSSTPASATVSTTRFSLPVSGSPHSDRPTDRFPARTSLPSSLSSTSDVLLPTHDSAGVRLHEVVKEEEEEEEGPTYDLVPPSPAGSRVQSSIGGSRAPSSLSSSDSSGDRGKIVRMFLCLRFVILRCYLDQLF